MSRFTIYLTRHYQAAMNAFGQLGRAPFTTFMTCLVIGITLALPAALWVALNNFHYFGGNLTETTEILVYLKPEIPAANVMQIVHQLQAHPDIKTVQTISPEQGLKELQQQAGFQGVLTELDSNPLPWALAILPRNPQAMTSLAQTLQQLPQVDAVQSDQTWMNRLTSWTILAKRIFYSLSFFLSLAVFLIINNVIHSATQHNHKEIEIIKLIGGTAAFIRRPFLYAGMLYGLLGGILAWQWIDILLLLLKNPSQQLASNYAVSFQLIGLSLHNTLILLSLSVFLGLLGSWLAVTRYLKTC